MDKSWCNRLEFNNAWCGLFLLYKSVQEIHHKVEGHEEEDGDSNGKATLNSVIFQITMINIVFSFDSILTAIGMTTVVNKEGTPIDEALIVMIIAVILSIIIMMLFAQPVNKVCKQTPNYTNVRVILFNFNRVYINF